MNLQGKLMSIPISHVGFQGGAVFENCFHETLHHSQPRSAVNYARCILCQGEMLRDSMSRICSRPLCRAVRIKMQKNFEANASALRY
jgi:cytochrome c-type biogenesis protein CcmH/NrfF